MGFYALVVQGGGGSATCDFNHFVEARPRSARTYSPQIIANSREFIPRA